MKETTPITYREISTYIRCPLRYRFQYIDGLRPSFTSVALAFGEVIHETLSIYAGYILEGHPVDVEEIIGHFTSLWVHAQSSEIPIKYGSKEDFERLFEKGKQLITLFYNRYPMDNISGTDMSFSIKADDFTPKLVASIDLVEEQEDKICLIDLKTSCRKPSGENPSEKDLKLALYALSADLNGRKNIQVKQVVLIKTQKPQLYVYSSEYNPHHSNWTINLVKDAYQGIYHQIFYPNPSFNCSNCPYQEPCSNYGSYN